MSQHVKPLLRLGGRLDVPLDHRQPQRPRHLPRQLGLAGAGFALDQKRPLQRDRGVHRHGQIARGDIAVGARLFGPSICGVSGLQSLATVAPSSDIPALQTK